MTDAITTRYGALAESSCCLSCGSAVQYVEALAGQRSLDLGCGRGNDVLRLAERVGATGHAYGIDITDTMLDKARSTAEKLGVTNATFLKADLTELPLGDAVIDWVTSNCVLNHASDKLAVWQEINRVLKPGGRFVVSDIYSLEPVPEQYRNDPAAVAECWAGAVTKAEYLETIAKAGLVGVSILEESAPYAKGRIAVSSFTISGVRLGVTSPFPGRTRNSCCS